MSIQICKLIFSTDLPEGDLAVVPEVGPLPLEVLVGLVPDDEHDVGRNLVGGLKF